MDEPLQNQKSENAAQNVSQHVREEKYQLATAVWQGAIFGMKPWEVTQFRDRVDYLSNAETT